MRKFFNKRKLGLLILGLALVVLTSCGKGEGTAEPSMEDIKIALEKDIDLSNFMPGDEEILEIFYEIEEDILDDYLLYTPRTNIHASEIGIFKLKDSKDMEEVREKVEKRVEIQANNFENYLPDQYYLVEKHLIKVKGDYLLLAIEENVDKVEKAFDQAFK